MSIVAGTLTAGNANLGGPATSAQLNLPYGVAPDSSGTGVYIAGPGCCVQCHNLQCSLSSSI